MGTFSWFRLAATATTIGILTITAAAADVGKGPGNDKDKKDTSSRGAVERSSTSRSSSADSSRAPATNRDPPVNRGVPTTNSGANPSVNTNVPAARSQPASQPHFSGGSVPGAGSWHDQWERDQWERDRWDRDQDERDHCEARNERLANANFNNFNANRFFSGTGTLISANQGLLQISADGAVYQIRPETNAKFEVTGTAGPNFLKPGLVVKFQAAFDPNGAVKNKALNPITSLEIITPQIGEPLGAVPAGADVAPNAKAPLPATARNLAVIGRILSYAKSELSVSADGRVFKADLDPAPVIKVRVTDARYARPGDQVDLTGYFVRPGIVIAGRVAIKLANPLGDPLSEFVKQKPAPIRAPPSGGPG